MKRHARLWFAGALVVALAVGSMVAAERSSVAMATAASKFLGALTPENAGRRRSPPAPRAAAWGFPSEMFRQGLLTRHERVQRKLVHELLKAGLAARLHDRQPIMGSRK
jgi:hypothetical protein